jgi:hypothetical protein
MGHKAGTGSEKSDGKPAQSRLIRVKGQNAEEERDDHRDGGGKPVHAVKEIHGIGEPDDPEHGQDDADRASPCRVAEGSDMDVAKKNDEEWRSGPE